MNGPERGEARARGRGCVSGNGQAGRLNQSEKKEVFAARAPPGTFPRDGCAPAREREALKIFILPQLSASTRKRGQ